MAVRTLSQYPPEFKQIWDLAAAGTLLLEFPKRGTAVNLRWRLYAYRKRLQEEAPLMAQPYKAMDLVVTTAANANGMYELKSVELAWKKQVREQLAAAGLATPPAGIPGMQPLPMPVIPPPLLPVQEVQAEPSAMDSTLKSLGFGTPTPEDASKNS